MLTQQLSQSSLAYPKRVPHRKNTRSRRTLEDYEFVSDETSLLKTSDLGAGALGRVKRVREKATGELFAMKIMNKNNIFRYSSKENLKREVSLQKNIQHPHIVKLYHYFEDQDNVYIVLELAENGSLFDYIRAKGKCSEDEAFVYFFQTALAINYLHKNNIIHRDLKPENLLIDKNGNVKVCDFGWSAETQNKRATYCGTVEYMAPEMIKNLPYDQRIDIWSLGILLYELLHGHSPYKGRTDQEKSFNIAKNIPIQFNPSISVEACDLILNLLQPVPSHRLTMDEIFRHRWMRKYEELYQINIMSYVREQEENEGERSSSEESKRESYKDSAEARSARNSEALKNRLPAGSVTSLDGSIKARKDLEGQIRSYGTVSTKGSETGSGDFSYHRDSHDGLYKYKSNHAAIQAIEEERMRGSRTKQSASVDRYENTVSRGSLRGSDTLTQLFKRNHAIEEKLHRHHAESEIGFFKKLFIKLGCFDREKELSLL